MRTWGWLLAALGWALCVTVGFLALLVAVAPETAPRLLEERGTRLWHALCWHVPGTEYRWAYWVLGVALIAGPALALGVPMARWRYRRHLEFAGEHGTVLVDVAGVEECLRKVLSEEEGVGRARVQLSSDRAELFCAVTVWLEAASDVVARVRQLETRLLEYYRYVLPEGKPMRVEIRTRLIYQRPAAGLPARRGAAGASAAARGEGRGEDYYGGPRYPVDAGDADSGSMTSS
jgi:hypothetical protein